MKTKFFSVLLITGCLVCNVSRGQTEGQNDDHRLSFKLGAYYNSHLNYYGRTSGSRSSGVFPLGEVWMGTCIYASIAPVFVSNEGQRFQYAGTLATVGYRGHAKDRVSWHIYLARPFYKKEARLVQSSLKAQAAGSVCIQMGILNVTAGGDLKFSTAMDYGVHAGIDHVIRGGLGKGWALAVDPSAYVYAGTQRFSESSEQGIPGLPPGPQRSTEEKFMLLSYEFTSAVVLTKSQWQLLVIPAYVLPRNVQAGGNTEAMTQDAGNILYFTAGIKVNF